MTQKDAIKVKLPQRRIRNRRMEIVSPAATRPWRASPTDGQSPT